MIGNFRSSHISWQNWAKTMIKRAATRRPSGDHIRIRNKIILKEIIKLYTNLILQKMKLVFNHSLQPMSNCMWLSQKWVIDELQYTIEVSTALRWLSSQPHLAQSIQQRRRGMYSSRWDQVSLQFASFLYLYCIVV